MRMLPYDATSDLDCAAKLELTASRLLN